MKTDLFPPRFILAALAVVLLPGCLLKPVTDSTRCFILSPISTNAPAPATSQEFSIGLGYVKMPQYLLQDSIVVRNSANEITYLEDARWAESLNDCFQQTLAANLSRLLPADKIYLTDWPRNQASLAVFVDVRDFDVETGGHGTLVADWRIVAPDTGATLNSGDVRLDLAGSSPKGKPETIAATLSSLEADFSRGLAQSIRESEEANTHLRQAALKPQER